jgi:mannose-6-phosphate isomerase-like protein (cupin superfamily)
LLWVVTLTLAFIAGYAVGPANSAAADQATATQQTTAGRGQQPQIAGALPPGEHSKISLSPDQGEPTLFAGADLRRYHTELQARVQAGGVAAPRDLLKPMLTRTHSFTMVHRGQSASTQPAGPEQHEGVTDAYFVVGGSGTVVVGGQIPNRRGPARRIRRRSRFKGDGVQAAGGDIFDIPPNTPHATMADAGGMTYVLMKVNVGCTRGRW